MTFNDKTVQDLNIVSTCNSIQGVNMSAEELDSLKDAAILQADARDDIFVEESKIGSSVPSAKPLEIIGTKAKIAPPVFDDLSPKMEAESLMQP